MSPTYVLGLVFAGIILVTVFVKMRNSGLKESYGVVLLLLSLRFSVDLSKIEATGFTPADSSQRIDTYVASLRS